MEITDIEQLPLSSTDMSCMKGASDYFNNDLSTAMLYGLSGYGYMINIHKELCPSGPYVWKRDRFYSLLREIGVSYEKGYRLDKNSTPEERANVESVLRDYLNKGSLCVLGFLESQLFKGYDEEGFFFSTPWGDECTETVIQRLTYGSWKECLDREGWVIFAIFSPNDKRTELLQSIRKSWEYGLELYQNPKQYQEDGYGINYAGIANWISCVEQGLSESHGHWWNGMVWTECRKMMSDFFLEITGLFDSEDIDATCRRMSALYKKSEQALDQIKENDLAKDQKIALLKDLQEIDQELEKGLIQLLKLSES